MPAIVRPGVLMPVRKIIVPTNSVFTSDYGTLTMINYEDINDVLYMLSPYNTVSSTFSPTSWAGDAAAGTVGSFGSY